MEHRQLGTSGLMVSEFGMGCGNFGGVGSAPEFFGQGESRKDAFALLDHALELGINFLDTADAYGGGRSERFIGEWLATKGASVRDSLLVSSKVGNAVGPTANDQGLSRGHILRQVDASLGRLGVDRLDMYLVHLSDPDTPIEETVEALDSLVLAGKVRYLGVSNWRAWMVARALWIADVGGYHSFGWVQNSYSLIDRTDDAEMLPLCRDRGLGYTPFSPLGGGMLTGKYSYDGDYPDGSRMTLRPEPYLRYWTRAVFDDLDALSARAADLGVSPAGLSLAWLRRHPDVTAPIVGPRRPEHFGPVEEALGLDLSRDQWDELGNLFSEEAPSVS